jgi:hypothetical protein
VRFLKSMAARQVSAFSNSGSSGTTLVRKKRFSQ